jgi:hypothetical protein
MKPGREHVTIAVSGAHGGRTIDFRGLAHRGMTLVGVTESFNDGVVTFKQDLVGNLNRGDENYLALLDAADAYIERNGLDLPEEPEARETFPEPECVKNPLADLDLAKAGITSIIWATGLPWITPGCKSMPSTTKASLCISAACRVSRGVLPRSAVAVASRFVVHLGCVA